LLLLSLLSFFSILYKSLSTVNQQHAPGSSWETKRKTDGDGWNESVCVAL
jgi:hypothetical protein